MSENDANSVQKFLSSQTFAFTPFLLCHYGLELKHLDKNFRIKTESSFRRKDQEIQTPQKSLIGADSATQTRKQLICVFSHQRNLLPYQFSSDFVRKLLHLPSFFSTSHLTTALASKCTSDAA